MFGAAQCNVAFTCAEGTMLQIATRACVVYEPEKIRHMRARYGCRACLTACVRHAACVYARRAVVCAFFRYEEEMTAAPKRAGTLPFAARVRS